MGQLYEKLQKGGKARAACAGWILYWGITLGLLLFEKERIIGTTEEEKRIYLPVFAVLVILTLGLLLFEKERIIGTTEEEKRIYLPVFAVLVILCFGGWLLTMARFARMPEKKRKPRLVNIKMLLPVLLNAVYLFFEIEYIGNTEFFQMKWYYMLLNVAVIFLFCIFLTGIFNSLKRAMIFLNIFYYLMSLVFYYVYLFRGEAFQLIDLYSIGTAMEVVGGYQFEITRQMVLMLVGTLILLSLWKQSGDWVIIRKGRLPKILLRVITALLIGVFYLLYMYLNWNAQFGVISDLWNPAKTYRQYGTTVGFMAVAKYMRLTPPEGYSVSEVERIIENSEEKNAGDEEDSGKNSEDPEQEEKVTPVNIIAVMNESWFDYRTIGDPKTSESYMPFLIPLRTISSKAIR